MPDSTNTESTHKFFTCKRCGNVVGMAVNKGGPLSCCGEAMAELKPNTTDAAREKHLPKVEHASGKLEISVGSIDHPMTEEHHIEFIYVETVKGGLRRRLKAGDAPKATIRIDDEDRPVAVFAYCNLHGLWRTEL